MSHTPGPWEIDKRLSGYEVKAKDKNLWVCSVYGDSDNVDEANARLIAAAPELLEALIYCRQKMDYMMTHGEWYSPGRALEMADAAIAKAKGEV